MHLPGLHTSCDHHSLLALPMPGLLLPLLDPAPGPTQAPPRPMLPHQGGLPPLPRPTAEKLGSKDSRPGCLVLSPHTPWPSSPEPGPQGLTSPTEDRASQRKEHPRTTRTEGSEGQRGHRAQGPRELLSHPAGFLGHIPHNRPCWHLAIPHSCSWGTGTPGLEGPLSSTLITAPDLCQGPKPPGGLFGVTDCLLSLGGWEFRFRV